MGLEFLKPQYKERLDVTIHRGKGVQELHSARPNLNLTRIRGKETEKGKLSTKFHWA